MKNIKKLSKKGLLLLGLVISIASLVTAGFIGFILSDTEEVTVVQKDWYVKKQYDTQPASGSSGSTSIPAVLSGSFNLNAGATKEIHFYIGGSNLNGYVFTPIVTVPEGLTYQLWNEDETEEITTVTGALGYARFVVYVIADEWITSGIYNVDIDVDIPTIP